MSRDNSPRADLDWIKRWVYLGLFLQACFWIGIPLAIFIGTVLGDWYYR